MPKNRKIPFGYRMENGVITANPNEVLAVITIFKDYLAGMSLSEIAQKQTVPYKDDALWNKNMVKRILDNKVYTGNEIYPKLVDKSDFDAAKECKSRRAAQKAELSEELRAIRRLTYCAECGQRLTRSGGNGKYERWNCKNHDCFQYEFRLTDQMLMGAVLQVMNTAIANPALLEVESEICFYAPTAEVTRRQNEINHMLDATQLDFERIKARLLTLAEVKYDCCQYSDDVQKTAQLRDVLSEKEQLNTIDIGLLKSCIKRVLVSHLCEISVEYINGATIKNITERGDNYADSGKCDGHTGEKCSD